MRRGKRLTWFVHDALWKRAGLKPTEFVCRACLEARIGRPLTFKDYAARTYVPITRKRWRADLRGRGFAALKRI